MLLVTLAVALAACGRVAGDHAALTPASGKRADGARGMVVASQVDAAAAGAELLRAGGNAADAAVAVAFALSVTDISQTGIGGGGAMLHYDARARRASHLSFYPRTGADPAWGAAEAAGSRRPGRIAATPGMVAGLLETHRRFGRLPLAQVMAPAIRLAREGFIVGPLLARTIASSREKLLADSAAARLLLPNGEALRPGDRLVQPVLAATLEAIARGGREAFHTGPIATRLAATVRAQGGLITERDLRVYPVADGPPLCTEWRGHTVLGAPAPVGGAPVLAMLHLAEAAGLTRGAGFTTSPQAVVTMTGVIRTATADGGSWRGDPAVMPVPMRGVVHAGYARSRAALVQAAATDTVRAGDPWPFEAAPLPAACAAYPMPVATRPQMGGAVRPDGGEGTVDGAAPASYTSHLAVIDADGDAVSMTTTVGLLFGSGVYTDGFFLNSSGANLDARTRGPDRYTNSTIAPTIILDRDRVRLLIGAGGSQYIQPSVTQVTLRLLAFGEDPTLAMAAPRILASPARTEVEVEPGFSSAVYAGLVAKGYRPLSRVADITFGGLHAIVVERGGRRIGVADPRRDGVAIAQ
ncbi:MAG: gamma-glutamyltransferase family protein [Gemmatimonadaceae bacterium]